MYSKYNNGPKNINARNARKVPENLNENKLVPKVHKTEPIIFGDKNLEKKFIEKQEFTLGNMPASLER